MEYYSAIKTNETLYLDRNPTVWMELEKNIFNEISQTLTRQSTAYSHSFVEAKTVNLIDEESRMVVTRYQDW
jgi:hypothetical protein